MTITTQEALCLLQQSQEFRLIVRAGLVDMDKDKANTRQDFLDKTVKIGRPAFKSAEQFKDSLKKNTFESVDFFTGLLKSGEMPSEIIQGIDVQGIIEAIELYKQLVNEYED